MTADIDFPDGHPSPPKPSFPTVAVGHRRAAGRALLVVRRKDDQAHLQRWTLGSSSGRNTQILEASKPGTRVVHRSAALGQIQRAGLGRTAECLKAVSHCCSVFSARIHGWRPGFGRWGLAVAEGDCGPGPGCIGAGIIPAEGSPPARFARISAIQAWPFRR